ncbi:MAG TPA: hypothetical protein VIM16_18260 [Mucilaginibacter sp.]
MDKELRSRQWFGRKSKDDFIYWAWMKNQGITGLCMMTLLPFIVYFVALAGAFSSSGQAVWAAIFAIAVLATAEAVWPIDTLEKTLFK